MPSLFVLKRSGRDASPWSRRPWHLHPAGPGDDLAIASDDDGNDRFADESNGSGSGSGSGYTSGYTSGNEKTVPPSASSALLSPTTTTTTNRERRDSKRDLLQDLIRRSLRGAGRALSATSTPSTPTSAPTSAPASAAASRHPSRRPSKPLHPRRHPRPARHSSTATAATRHLDQTSPFSLDEDNDDEDDDGDDDAVRNTPLLSASSRSASVNANKPLPSPPLPGSKLDVGPPARPVLKLARIMASLTDDDIEKLFSGAPQYFARSEGHFTGAPHPSVAYPWDEALGIRDLTDHVQIEDEAWSNVTAWPHIVRRTPAAAVTGAVAGDGDGLVLADEAPSPTKKRSHFYPRCRERPSMLSIQGLEKGTVGYEAALELAVSDALQEEQYGFDTLGSRPDVVLAARKNLMDPVAAAGAIAEATERPEKAADGANAGAVDETANGVKYVGETQILEELIKNGNRYADGSFYDESQGKDFYNELFHHILRPPKHFHSLHRYASSHAGNSTHANGHLVPQIEALLDVLALPNVWIDFSHVEWRLRLGQILWASSAQDEFDPGAGKPPGESASSQQQQQDHCHYDHRYPATCDERYTERYWLLLQILLATELLLRLDAITDGDEYGLDAVRPSQIHRFEKVASPSVRWSLILARAWLENMEVVRVDDEDKKKAEAADEEGKGKPDTAPATPNRESSVDSPKSGVKPKREHSLRHTMGWITTLTRKLSLIDGRLHASKVPETKYVYAVKARHVRRQCRGVAHFAQELRWPNDLGDLLAQSATTLARAPEPLNRTIATPPSVDGDLLKSRLEFSRRLPRRRKVVAGLHPGGWLSRSFLSGLMLPGDGLCNLLMATLLERDEAALRSLGPVAQLGGGFVYKGKSFWSTACVAGRVLAAGAGAAECMGWVSSDVVPEALGDGWVNIDVDDVGDDVRHTGRRARIWDKATIERSSSVLGDADPASVLPADFVIPYEAVYEETPPRHTHVELRRFGLYKPYKPARDKEEKQVAQEGATTGPTPAPPTSEPYFAEVAFAVASDGGPEQVYTYNLSYDIYFATAHPCVPSQRVKILKSPSSPTIQQIDVSGTGLAGRASSVHATGHPLHKYFAYASIHLTTLLRNRDKSLGVLLAEYAASTNRSTMAAASAAATPAPATTPSTTPPDHRTVLVIDCITGFSPQPAAHEMPLSPVLDRKHSWSEVSSSATSVSFPPLTKEISPIAALSGGTSGPLAGTPVTSPASVAARAVTPVRTPVGNAARAVTPVSTPAGNAATAATTATATSRTAASNMHHETRRRRFGSDAEILVRAICAEKGWNALVSRRRRGCLACAIREAGALGWRVVIRVD
ncbi:hypothetical protein SPI_04693 [Niveomyces insectorum RCEF 264]|uniref:Uncharacterized protein n=1 Tax=Niveomyces insectorum RCEF 264 TaxID=1081102 RepID=A0A167URM7_9HYPO|nr:hypothetical protein SPI_04693 [Niveomyces insectorum RCEF 264]